MNGILPRRIRLRSLPKRLDLPAIILNLVLLPSVGIVVRKATRSLPVLSLPTPRPSRRTSRLSLMHVAFPVLVTGLALRLPRMAPRSFSTPKDITFTQLPRRNELRRRIPPPRIPPPRTPRPSSLPLSSLLLVPLLPSWKRPLLLVAPSESPSTLAAHLTSLRDTLLNDLKEE